MKKNNLVSQNRKKQNETKQKKTLKKEGWNLWTKIAQAITPVLPTAPAPQP